MVVSKRPWRFASTFILADTGNINVFKYSHNTEYSRFQYLSKIFDKTKASYLTNEL